MKQTNKLQKIFSVGLSCVSLFFLITMVGCSKEIVEEEIPLTKSGLNPNPVGSAENPYGPGQIPTLSAAEGSDWHYFRMHLKTCTIKTTIPARKHGMIVMVSGPAVARTVTYSLDSYPGMIYSESHTFSTGTGGMILRIPPAACGPKPPSFLPAEQVIIKIDNTEGSMMGVKFTYFTDSGSPTQPGPIPGV